MKVNNKFLTGEALIQGRTNTIKEVSQKANVDPYGGHEYVDLGLPSGTLWAKWNVGATSETDTGLYFQWGDTQGYTADQVGNGEGKKYFWWADYTFNPSGDGTTFTKYDATDEKTTLDLEDDAANVYMGGDWHMPTEEQFQELLDNTEKRWTSRTVGSTIVNGYEFAKSGDTTFSGDTLFIPAAGNVGQGHTDNVGNFGFVQSSSLYSSGVESGRFLFFNSNSVVVGRTNRFNGLSVRGVIG